MSMQLSTLARCAALLFLSSTASCDRSARPEGPRNLLFVSIDTLRADHLSSYGYGRKTSPNLDALAARSQRFENLWSVMPTTLPAHTAMFTSMFPTMVGVHANGQAVSPDAYTLAERLAKQGFQTGAFVSATPLHPRFGLNQGFETYDHPQGEERPGDETRERAVAWLREHKKDRFFCFVHFFDPHSWYTAPEEQRAAFSAPAGRQPPERDFLQHPELLGAAQRTAATNAYDAEIRFADAQLGMLLEELASLGLEESTVVVVTSDHGETLDELIDLYHYGYDHGEFLHRRELRVPLVIHVPDAAAKPGVQSATASSLDLLPTVLELLGAPSEQPLLGRSLVPLLAGERLPPRPAFSERRALTPSEVRSPPSPFLIGHEYAAVTEDWLFVETQVRPRELYDLQRDPTAATNVAAGQPGEVARMAKLVEDWRKVQDAAVKAPGAGGETEPLDPALVEALRALGYVTE